MKKQAAFSTSPRPVTGKKKGLTKTLTSETEKKQEVKSPVKSSQSKQTQVLEVDKIYETIEELIAKQKQYQVMGKYVEAEGCKRKVHDLRELAEKQKVSEIRRRHKQELMEIEQAHLEELNCFNIKWDQTISKLYQSIEAMEEDLVKKHEEQIAAVEVEISEEKPRNFKESPQLLNLRKIEGELARQENYMEAHQVQRKAEQLEKEELEKWKKNQQSKGKNNLNALRVRQEAELSALRQKIQLGVEENERQKRLEEEKLILKYENVVKELQFQQNQEVQKLEKEAKLSQHHKTNRLGSMGSASRISMA